ncbi:hypothetical protein ACE1OC_01285 [Streptomyces sp. DSM 116496]|uniref:hypothetical protein n=1 Tax=Streptomyces stoeckheimensis TaxID=3344656 RepID=UPI0038B3016D
MHAQLSGHLVGDRPALGEMVVARLLEPLEQLLDSLVVLAQQHDRVHGRLLHEGAALETARPGH